MFSCIFFPRGRFFKCCWQSRQKTDHFQRVESRRVRGHEMGEKSVQRDDCQNQW